MRLHNINMFVKTIAISLENDYSLKVKKTQLYFKTKLVLNIRNMVKQNCRNRLQPKF